MFPVTVIPTCILVLAFIGTLLPLLGPDVTEDVPTMLTWLLPATAAPVCWKYTTAAFDWSPIVVPAEGYIFNVVADVLV